MIGVYGANGFIGRHLVTRLAKTLRPVRAVSRRLDDGFFRGMPSNVEGIEADFRDSVGVASSLQGVKTVVDLIGTSSPGLKNDHMISDIMENVIPHVEFLQHCVHAGVERFVFISSGGAVYGPDAQIPTRENDVTNPVSSHGLTKLTVEKYIQMCAHVYGLQYVILRVSNLYGPGQMFRRGQGLIPAVLHHWRNGLPITIFGDGSARRDYIYIDDAIDAIVSAISLGGQARDIINIGSGETKTIIDVIEAIEAASNIAVARHFVAERSTDVQEVRLDIRFAGTRLNWFPKTLFHAGIVKTLATEKI